MSAEAPLTVALDVTARINGTTGVARYATQLQQQLVEMGVVVRPYAVGRAVVGVPDGIARLRIPLRVVHRGWATVGLPKAEWFVPPAEVVHTLDLVAPPTRRPSLMTVHDLDAVDYPTLHAPRAIATTRAQLASLRRVRVVVTNSETTKRAVVRHGVPEEKVVVALLGLSPLPPAGPARLEGIDRYVLCVGGLNLRKGQDVLLRAWARRRPDGTALVLAGPDGYGSAEMHNFAASLPGDRPVRFEGLVDDRRLSALYAGAAAVCAPSRSEGFGLPVLEALAAGVPVVATDIEAFREVAADTALFVPPEDEGALAEALDAALDGSPDVRQHVAAGRGRARQFTWRRCAAATIDAYRQAIG